MKKRLLISRVIALTVLLFAVSLFIGSFNLPIATAATAQSRCTALYPPKSSTAGRNGCLAGYAAGKAGQSNASNFCRAQFPPKSSTDGRNGCLAGYAAGKADRGGGGTGGGGSGSGGSTGSGGGAGGGSSSSGGGNPGAGAGAKPDSGPNFPGIDCKVKDSETGKATGKYDCSDPAADPDATCDREGCDLIKKYVNPAIKALSAMVGIAAVISLIYGGIMYSASGGDPQKVTEAKDRISKTIIAFVAYMFLAAFLEFIVPGGIFR